ncbi:hypothetical protein EDD85DRAFT_793697 [Armillaria nabsnona]|nr:hypothetical protein EDD85DRAFT_793697 [Armillaria nabsnona]
MTLRRQMWARKVQQKTRKTTRGLVHGQEVCGPGTPMVKYSIWASTPILLSSSTSSIPRTGGVPAARERERKGDGKNMMVDTEYFLQCHDKANISVVVTLERYSACFLGRLGLTLTVPSFQMALCVPQASGISKTSNSIYANI